MQQPNHASQKDCLKRLPPQHYRGEVYVHWTMTVQDRKQGWLIPIFYYKFRELLTHTCFRHNVACPIYCCMPDHIHLLLVGYSSTSDQRIAIRFLRTHLNGALTKLGFQLQQQPHDHVLREEEREQSAFEEVAEYIARNPERAGLVEADGFKSYSYTGCLVPGFPDLSTFQEDYWELFWRLYAKLRESQ